MAVLEARKQAREAALAEAAGDAGDAPVADGEKDDKEKEKEEINDDDVVNADVGALEEKMETSEEPPKQPAAESTATPASDQPKTDDTDGQ